MKRILVLLAVLLGIGGVLAQSALKVRIGFNPTQNSDQLSQAAQAIASFIEDRLGGAVEVEVFLPTEYRGLVEATRSGKLDFAFFPPDGYVIASREAGAKVLLKSVRFGNAYYWSAIIVRKDSGYNRIEDLEGKTIAWVDPNSAAGYVFPRAALLARGINPDTFFGKQVFAGKHDAAVLAVLNRSVDAAAVFANDDQNKSGAWTQFLSLKEAAQIHAIFYTKPIPGDTFSVSGAFYKKYPKLTEKIKEAIMSCKVDEGCDLLKNLYRIDYMVPATDKDYDVVREARRLLGLDKE
jgi:phosphonate transport system substrate-binding protein